jgi:hypothetical protein
MDDFQCRLQNSTASLINCVERRKGSFVMSWPINRSFMYNRLAGELKEHKRGLIDHYLKQNAIDFIG